MLPANRFNVSCGFIIARNEKKLNTLFEKHDVFPFALLKGVQSLGKVSASKSRFLNRLTCLNGLDLKHYYSANERAFSCIIFSVVLYSCTIALLPGFEIRPELMIDRHNAFQGLLPYLLRIFSARLKR